MTLYRLFELLPLALVLGTVLGALRHERMPAIQRASLKNTARILGWLIGGSLLLHVLLMLVQD